MKKILVLFVALLIGCSEDSTGPTGSSGSAGEILPLTVGNTWEYEQAYINPFDQTADKDTISLSVYDSTMRQDSIMIYYATDGAVVYNDASGLWSANEIDNAQSSLLAKYPGYSGEIFNRITVYAGDGDSASAKVRIESTSHLAKVPAGSFICYKYTADYISKQTGKTVQRINAYYAPNIGLVKQEGYFVIDTKGTLGLIIERKLLSYSIIH
ncbi:MAG TPA: hypothetical protein VIX80_05250 [Candidatus Kapabacteria bacterium]